MSQETATKMRVGDSMPHLELQSVAGQPIRIPNPNTPWVHIQFRRFAGCPICNLHIDSFVKHQAELTQKGIQEVIFFHSSREALLPYYAKLPFDLVADPEKKYYHQFGVSTSIRAVLSLSAMGAAFKGSRLIKSPAARENGPLGLPADMLIDRQGRVVAVKYGTHANDHWSVDELFQRASLDP